MQRTTCDGVTDGLNFRLARANRPEITDDTIYVPKRHEGRSQLDSFQRFRVPSQILVTGVLATERMTVYSVNLTSNATHIVLKVNRTDPVVFATDETKNLRDIPQLPATPPESWICSPDNYNQRDGCDCKCGALDPDCLNPTQAVFNCEAGMTCSTEGECSVADANKNIVSISQPCRKLLLPGEFELVGYVGSMNQYIRESRNRCTPCYDVLYNGEPQLDESFASENGGMGQFVCDYAANGFALSRSIVDQELSDSVLHDETKVNGHRWIEVSVGPHPMFPVKTENDTRRAYKVKLSADQGNEEIVDVIQTESPHSKGFQRFDYKAY